MDFLRHHLSTRFPRLMLLTGCMVFTAFFATADQVKTLAIELNTLSQQDGACRMMFLVENSLGADLEKAVFETVLFKKDGSVDRLTLFDFQKLPTGRPRVRQFDISGSSCGDISRVLINGVHACQGEGISGEICINALKLTSKTDVEVLG